MPGLRPALETRARPHYIQSLQDGEIGWGSTEFIVMRAVPPVPPAYTYLLARDPGFLRAHTIQSMTGTSGRQRASTRSTETLSASVPAPAIPGSAFRLAHRHDCSLELRLTERNPAPFAAQRDALTAGVGERGVEGRMMQVNSTHDANDQIKITETSIEFPEEKITTSVQVDAQLVCLCPTSVSRFQEITPTLHGILVNWMLKNEPSSIKLQTGEQIKVMASRNSVIPLEGLVTGLDTGELLYSVRFGLINFPDFMIPGFLEFHEHEDGQAEVYPSK